VDLTCKKSRPLDHPFVNPDLCVRHARSKKSIVPTPGERLRRDVRIAVLSQDVHNLRAVVKLLMSVVDVEDVAAAVRLQQMSPSNAQLKLWAAASDAPAHLCGQQEERPW